jgi:hypothetical protein
VIGITGCMLKVWDRYELQEVRVAVLSMSGFEYTGSQLISQSEETMRPQLMCCALSNLSLSQFRMEVRVSRGECPKGQGLQGAYSLERLLAKGIHPENRVDSINGRTGVRG